MCIASFFCACNNSGSHSPHHGIPFLNFSAGASNADRKGTSGGDGDEAGNRWDASRCRRMVKTQSFWSSKRGLSRLPERWSFPRRMADVLVVSEAYACTSLSHVIVLLHDYSSREGEKRSRVARSSLSHTFPLMLHGIFQRPLLSAKTDHALHKSNRERVLSCNISLVRSFTVVSPSRPGICYTFSATTNGTVKGAAIPCTEIEQYRAMKDILTRRKTGACNPGNIYRIAGVW